MQRILIPFASLVALAGSAHAQPAPAPEPAGPPSQPADQPPNQPEQPPAEAAPPVQPAPAPAEAKPEGPRKLSVGKESPGATFTPGLNMQGWFVYDESKKLATATTEETDTSTSTFRIKRLEVSGGGDLIPGAIKYKFMFDLGRVLDTTTTTNAGNPTTGGAAVPITTSGGPFSTLQDFFVTFTGDYADVSIGQFKNTVSWEAYQPATKIILPERSFIGAQIGGKRDVGIRIDKTFKKFMYSLNLFNGAGQNTLDNNNQKDVSFRLEVYPIPGMTIAGSTYDSIGYRTRAGTKDRWEGDFVYETGPFKIQAEYIRLQDVLVADADPIKSQGAYVALAYKFPEMGSGAWKGVLQPVVRFGYWDPNADTNVDPSTTPPTSTNANIVSRVNDERFDYEVGFNYYLRGHEMKIQASYDRQQYDNSSVKPAVNEVIVATQLWF